MSIPRHKPSRRQIEQHYTLNEVAELLGVSRRKVNYLLNEHDMPRIVFSTTLVRVAASTVNALLQKCSTNPDFAANDQLSNQKEINR